MGGRADTAPVTQPPPGDPAWAPPPGQRVAGASTSDPGVIVENGSRLPGWAKLAAAAVLIAAIVALFLLL